MAQRLATEYVKANLQLTELQMNQLLNSMEHLFVHPKVKVLESGEQEIVLVDVSGEEVHLPIVCKDGVYLCELSCRLVNPRLTNAVRKLFMTYKGDGVVNRIYQGFTMKYYYVHGSVQRIEEITSEGIRLVFEHKQTLNDLEQLFQKTGVEEEITVTYKDIDFWLDQRNKAVSNNEIKFIDEKLRLGTAKWFAMEA
ncbi:non-ribosomal peptide synthetase module [Paenibacillus glacialis]|uniref:Non-ribosomal peptide synthetase module n=1 Tax=Paenibacillus glacialis TaxID=494026 RepID=A0A168PEG1_9BACL|nr:non-ribosomal peptide synthetase module [Paenibacillus glacialis]OAB46683.1 non-ribosomal peptide synthetase module [Paenibacillus glacialis]